MSRYKKELEETLRWIEENPDLVDDEMRKLEQRIRKQLEEM